MFFILFLWAACILQSYDRFESPWKFKKNILSESFLSNSVHKKRDANYGKYLTFEKENDSKYHLFESIYIQIVNMVTRWS